MLTELFSWPGLLIAAVFGLTGVLTTLWYRRLLRKIALLNTEKQAVSTELESVLVSRRQLESALEQVELLHRSKNQFYYTASHDLRQPLHALSMFSSILLKAEA